MLKKHFYHGLTSGIMAALAAIIYSRIHFFATQADFAAVINPGTMISLNIGVCLLISIAYYLFTIIAKKKRELVFNLMISILSFAAVIIPISVSLPLSVRNPELFPGLAVPMVFFPALAWFTFKPLFIAESASTQ
jgi:hypothetical protein